MSKVRGTRRTQEVSQDSNAVESALPLDDMRSEPEVSYETVIENAVVPSEAGGSIQVDENGTWEGEVTITLPVAWLREGYVKRTIGRQVFTRLTEEQGRALKALRFALSEQCRRAKTNGARHRDGKVVDNEGDVIKYVLDQVAVQIAGSIR